MIAALREGEHPSVLEVPGPRQQRKKKPSPCSKGKATILWEVRATVLRINFGDVLPPPFPEVQEEAAEPLQPKMKVGQALIGT